ncbi:MAG: hypothetical protein QOE32_2262 [Pseudonocardiales bacterium]|jgi:hypothetical protein|nr:hypothetical protein [Pseudonocardiales bacterium]MDT7584712.1 hypothetical protein [Pseudonocardiales bacterium]MDT7626102.1 hypothetical protein [Pseudonocardiales bacterium]MDT7678013.1 hypothetical protein [Pseudonocardiales bacterium]
MALRSGLAMSELSPRRLWQDSLALGGSLSQAELESVLRGKENVSDYEHDLIAQALNDHFTDRGQNHPVPYSDDLRHRSSSPGDQPSTRS